MTTASAEGPVLSYIKDNIGYMVLNRPSAYNAWSYDMYDTMIGFLKKLSEDPSVHAIALTGRGKFFTAGNDLNINSSLYINESDPQKIREGITKLVYDNLDPFIERLIDLDKMLIGLINGPGIGVGATILGLMDFVVCHEDAYFAAPFTQLGINPEFCSSITFPSIIGPARTSDMFVGGRRVTAKEALDWGFINRLVTKDSCSQLGFQAFTHQLLTEMLSKSAVASLLQYRKLMRPEEQRKALHEARKRENALLFHLFQSPEAIKVARDFLDKKNKTKSS